MAVFGRRRRELDGRSSQSEYEDDALRRFEDLFSSPPLASALPTSLPVSVRAPVRQPRIEESTPESPELGDRDAEVRVPVVPNPERGSSLSRAGADNELSRPGTDNEGASMAQLEQSVQELLTIDGAVGVAIVDSASGMALAQGGHPAFDLGIAAAGNSNVVRAKLQTMKDLGLHSTIDDILITLDEQYHLINVLGGEGTEGLFVYLVLDRAKANLALARHRLASVSTQIVV